MEDSTRLTGAGDRRAQPQNVPPEAASVTAAVPPVASSSESSASSSSWWGWVSEKTSQLTEIIAQDLEEFTQEISTDTKSVVDQSLREMKKKTRATPGSGAEQHSASLLSSTLQSGLQALASGLGIEQEGEDDDEGREERNALNATGAADSASAAQTYEEAIVLNRSKALLMEMQRDPTTYCTEPQNAADFLSWQQEFDLSSRTEEISRLLIEEEVVRNMHSRLVPTTVSYGVFWQRYFYRREALQRAELRRDALLKRADAAINGAIDEEEFSWDDDDDDTAQSPPIGVVQEKAKAEPAEPAEPTHSTEPSEPTQSTEPSQPPEPTAPLTSCESGEVVSTNQRQAELPMSPAAVSVSPTDDSIHRLSSVVVTAPTLSSASVSSTTLSPVVPSPDASSFTVPSTHIDGTSSPHLTESPRSLVSASLEAESLAPASVTSSAVETPFCEQSNVTTASTAVDAPAAAEVDAAAAISTTMRSPPPAVVSNVALSSHGSVGVATITEPCVSPAIALAISETSNVPTHQEQSRQLESSPSPSISTTDPLHQPQAGQTQADDDDWADWE
mmetsp:Transcript_387/g.889  ORF Transcript_387/g.889 Transcript_387/m.889 type:complete len:561 (+) Transcript_387:131-1813(+)